MREWLTSQWETLATLWRELSPHVQDSIVTATFIIFVATFAAMLVIHHVGKQAARAVDGTVRAEAMRLKREVYKDLQVAIGSTIDTRQQLRSYVEDFLANVDLYRKDRSAKWAPSARPPELLQLFGTLTQTTGVLAGMLGRLKIIDPRMAVFPVAFAAALHDARYTFQAYAGPAIRVMAVQSKDGGAVSWNAPGDKDFERLERLSADLLRTLDIFGNYLADLVTETQNTLLGELFKRHLPSRTPAGADDVVIRLDRHAELMVHFETKSPWGIDRAVTRSAAQPAQRDAA